MTKGIRQLTVSLFGVLLLSSLGVAQSRSWPTPPQRPSYTPPPKPSYTPPAKTYSPPPSRPSQPRPVQPAYTPPNSTPRPTSPPASTPGHTYAPGTSAGVPPHTYTPGTSPSAPVRTYTPGRKPINEAPTSSSSGVTTFTPHAGGSGSSWTSSHSGGGTTEGVTSNGVTTFTPHASSESYTPMAGGTAGTYSGAKISSVSATGVGAKPSTGPVYSVPSTAVASKTSNGNSVLTPAGSTRVVHDVNSARAGLSGINQRPIPAGQVTAHANGSITVKASEGRQYGLRPNGTLASFQKPGLRATFAPNGHVSSLHTSTLDVRSGVGGGRTIVLHRGGAVIVSSGPHAGYVQRTVVNNGVSYVQRTYVSGTTVYTRNFTTFTYHGAVLTSYVPGFYYPAPFYGWAYYPWDAAVAYQWGWVGDPWYGYYGPYFAVSPFYAGPNFWLTDYYLGQVLADAYQARMDEQAAEDQQSEDDEDAAPPEDAGDAQPIAADTDAPITPQLKQAIAEEVKQQLAYENAASEAPAQSADLTGLPQVLVPNQIFVENAVISVLTSDGKNYCQLAPGDAVKVTEAAADSGAATTKVVASRRGDCPLDSVVTLSFDELQEMQNNFRAKLDSGLKDLHDEQGQEGLPSAPKSAMADAPHTSVNLPADPNAQAELNAATTEADQAQNNAAKTAVDSTQTASAKQ